MFVPGKVLGDKAGPKILGWTLIFRANPLYFYGRFGDRGKWGQAAIFL